MGLCITIARAVSNPHIPKDEEKRQLYEVGKKLLSKNGYHEIGMDHFALEEDTLFESFKNKKLHRNFMGYSSSKTQLMIGLGVSSISDSWYSFAQNVKTIEEYYECIEKGELPVYRGHILTPEDLIIRQHILNLMCQFETSWKDENLYFEELPEVIAQLEEMQKDGLIISKDQKITVLEAGKPFVRNICMAFDLLLKRKAPETALFSMTV